MLYIEDNLSNLTLIEQMLQERPEIELLPAIKGKLGLELAQQYSPDLILLDLGLPNLNGIEAARRILKASPNSKILFITQNCSRELAEGAMRTGANGYLLKSDATDLPCAIETVLQGALFVSSRVKGRI